MSYSSPVYGYVTKKIIDLLEKGVCPWNKPWDDSMGMPKNYTTSIPYRGVNPFLLGLQGFNSPYWLTAKQIQSLKGTWKGKGSMVIFWKWIKGENNPDGTKEKGWPLLRYYNVWNLEQTEGIPQPKEVANIPMFYPLESAEKILAETPVKPILNHGGERACYSQELDKISMPIKESFNNTESYYCTLFHELGHATGHQSRLNRDLNGLFGDHSYSKEELIAELTAAFLCGNSGIENTVENSASYLGHWKAKLSKDDKFFVQAAGQAQRASDLILGIKFQDKETEIKTE